MQNIRRKKGIYQIYNAKSFQYLKSHLTLLIDPSAFFTSFPMFAYKKIQEEDI